jgi:hypothetical protein
VPVAIAHSAQQCIDICMEAGSDCGYVTWGFPESPYCLGLPNQADCSLMDSGPSDCGSHGNTGVHTYARKTSSLFGPGGRPFPR